MVHRFSHLGKIFNPRFRSSLIFFFFGFSLFFIDHSASVVGARRFLSETCENRLPRKEQCFIGGSSALVGGHDLPPRCYDIIPIETHHPQDANSVTTRFIVGEW